tara:strand:+ start:727 stop:891 length:165 start_codon:yes stop_codon:yes gene_type:complete
MPKYLCLLESGRDFILDSPYDKDDVEGAYELAYEAMDEAALMDDYLEDIRRIYE